MTSLINRDLLPHSTCFGCGLDNPMGLQISVFPDPPRDGALRAELLPQEHMAGFPGITHGGVIYTALDCLSTWVATLLGPNRRAVWILRSATTTYRNPALVDQPLTLEGSIKSQGGPWEPVVVRTEARRADGEVCVEAEFKVVPLSQDKLLAISGLPELPANWRFFLSGEG